MVKHTKHNRRKIKLIVKALIEINGDNLEGIDSEDATYILETILHDGCEVCQLDGSIEVLEFINL